MRMASEATLIRIDLANEDSSLVTRRRDVPLRRSSSDNGGDTVHLTLPGEVYSSVTDLSLSVKAQSE